MSKHSIIKAGVGIGLLASSLASTAASALQTFAEPMVFYKVNGGAVNYIALLPNISDSAVLMLDLYQSGSVNTWAYGVGGSIADSSAGGPVWSLQANIVAPANSASTKSDNVAYTTFNGAGDQMTGATSMSASTTTAFSLGSSWYGGGTAALTLAFSQTQTISSQVCFASFNLLVGTDGNLRVAEQSNSFTVKPSGMPVASGIVSYYPTSSGASSTSGSSEFSSTAWNAINFTATGQLGTVGLFKVPNTGPVSTFAASALPKGNLCASMYTSKTGLNAAGAVIGGPTGLIRLW